MKPLLVGQAPGPNTDPDAPLFPFPLTSTGGRLRLLMGISRGEYVRHFDRINLFRNFPGKGKGGDKFPMEKAKLLADTLAPMLTGRTIILVGRNVADAFRLDLGFHTWASHQLRRRTFGDPGTCQLAVVPHPSGRNHWYNTPGNKVAAKEFWNDFLNSATEDKKVLPFVGDGRKLIS